MPFLQEVSLEIWLVILCINGMLFVGMVVVGDPLGIALKTPFNIAGNVTALATPNIFNNTDQSGTLLGNTTSGVLNVTANNNPLGFLVDNFFYVLAVLWTFGQFITGGFIWDVIGLIGFPLQFVILLKGVIGMLLVRTIIYYATGR